MRPGMLQTARAVARNSNDELLRSRLPPPHGQSSQGATEPVALAISSAFNRGELDFCLRSGAPVPGWAAMPECIAAQRVLALGGNAPSVSFLGFAGIK